MKRHLEGRDARAIESWPAMPVTGSEQLELARVGGTDAIGMPAPVAQAVHGLSLGALRIVLGLGVASSLLATSLAAAAGASPGRIAIGVLLIAVWSGASLAPDQAARLLLPPGRTAALAVALAIAIALSSPHSPYEGVAYPLVGVAVVTERPRWVAACLCVLIGGYLAGLVLKGGSVRWLLTREHLYGEANNIVDLVLTGVVMLLAVWVLRTTLIRAPEILERARASGRGLTPALGAQLRDPAGLLAPAPATTLIERLTASERNVVALLAEGLTAKQIAYRHGRSLTTVRTQIAAAKRKTGARTIEQLVVFYIHGHAHARDDNHS